MGRRVNSYIAVDYLVMHSNAHLLIREILLS
jgi:hypothetical protein